MPRTWRSNVTQILALYFILNVMAVVCAGLARPSLLQDPSAAWLPFAAFLTWRVSRGGRAARVILIIVGGLSLVWAAHIGPSSWSPAVLALLAIYAVQIALLASPAVYQRTRPGTPAEPRIVAVLSTPPLWMLLSALLAGLIITLLYLGSMDIAAIPGCGPAGVTVSHLPSGCLGLARGYPLRFLSAYQGTPEIDQAALIKDWAQWSLVSFAALYLLWLPSRRTQRLPDQPSVPKVPSVV